MKYKVGQSWLGDNMKVRTIMQINRTPEKQTFTFFEQYDKPNSITIKSVTTSRQAFHEWLTKHHAELYKKR